MELIDIISNTLIYGSGLLVLVVLISFVFSKTKTEEEPRILYQAQHSNSRPKNPLRIANIEQVVLRKDQSISYPQIFRLDHIKTKEIKIVRKSTATKRESQEAMRFDPKHLTRTDGNGIRYTIVNDELKKKSFKAANFYL